MPSMPPIVTVPPDAGTPPVLTVPPLANGFRPEDEEAVVVAIVVPPEAVLASGSSDHTWPNVPLDMGWALQLHSTRSMPVVSKNQRVTFQVARTT